MQIQIDIRETVSKIDSSLKKELGVHYYIENVIKPHIKTKRFDELFIARMVTESLCDLYSHYVQWRAVGDKYIRMFYNRLRCIPGSPSIPATLDLIEKLAMFQLDSIGIGRYDIWSFSCHSSFILASLDGDFRIEEWEQLTDAGVWPCPFKKPADDNPIHINIGLGIDITGKIIQ